MSVGLKRSLHARSTLLLLHLINQFNIFRLETIVSRSIHASTLAYTKPTNNVCRLETIVSRSIHAFTLAYTKPTNNVCRLESIAPRSIHALLWDILNQQIMFLPNNSKIHVPKDFCARKLEIYRHNPTHAPTGNLWFTPN